MTLTVSVYVPCYNAEKTIGACLASLLAQRRKPDEIFVIDDGSTDNSLHIAKRYPGVRIVQHQKNMGLATARNSGIRFSRGELVASIDADCAADPLWLAILVTEMEKHPDLCGVSGAVHESERGTIADRWRTYHMAQHYGKKPRENPRFLFGANTIFRRDALKAAGPYPAALRTNGEDYNICRAIYGRIAGAKLRYLPNAYVNHLRRDSFRSLANTYWRYQTYISWAQPRARSAWITLRQTTTMLRQLWFMQLVMDFRQKRREGLLVALYMTAMLPWLQARQHLRNRSALRKAREKASQKAAAVPGKD